MLKIGHLNIRSLRNVSHLIQLRELAVSSRFDVLTISETWLNSSVTNYEIKIEGYKLYRLDRLHKKGGGVCAYVRKDIKVTVLDDISRISECNFHQLWLKLQCRKLKSINVCVSYRPPDCPLNCFEDYFKPSYMQALKSNKPTVVLGDLNCNILKDNPDSKALTSILSDLNLTQVIKTPTRITATCQSLIDVILISSPDLVCDHGVLQTILSDHLPIYVVLKLKLPKPSPCFITARSYKNYNPTQFSADLASKSASLLSIFNKEDVNAKLTIFNEVLQTTLQAHAPIKTIKVRSHPCSYVSQEIKELMHFRDVLHRIFLDTNRIRDWNEFKKISSLIKVTLKNAERDYIRNEVQTHKNNPGSLWKIIKSCVHSKAQESQIYSKDLKKLADEFNRFFSSVGKNAAESAALLDMTIDTTLPKVSSTLPTSVDPVNQFSFQPVSCTEVKRVILKMPTNKSPGPDKVNMRVIKDCLPVILGPLTDIINCSFTTSKFPDSWKEAEVIPLLKDGDPELPSNNRPLSLLGVASKICERIALNQFTSYLQRNKRLSPHQSGNRKHHSTETLNILMSDIILEAMDKRMVSALVLLDLSKAFDSINHHILLQKLSHVGASASSVSWFSSYLSGRSQTVRIRSTVSSSCPITHGVPQGAILSPLLFCIYMNDLPSVTRKSHLESYVDDSKLLVSFLVKDIDETRQILEEDLHRVAKWCSVNQLLINPDKTKFLLVGTRQMIQRLPYNIELSFLGKQIKPITNGKDLGVIVDSHLTFDHHINTTVASCMAKLCQINRVKDSFDKDTLGLIISTLVMSKLFYCSTVWSSTSAKNIKKLQAVQNFACGIVSRTRKFDHVSPAMKELMWLPVKEYLLFRDTIMTYKCMNDMAPPYLCSNFCNRAAIHGCLTRNRDQLQIPRYSTASGQRTFKYRAVKIWNDLDSRLKEIKTLKNFKYSLRTLMLEKLYK